jgi:hypothetical protein
LFVEMGANFLRRLALNFHLPELHLLHTWDYRCEPPNRPCYCFFSSQVYMTHTLWMYLCQMDKTE